MASIFGLAVGVASDRGPWVPVGSTVRLSTVDDVRMGEGSGVDVHGGGNVAAANGSTKPSRTPPTQADNSIGINAMETA